MPNSEVVLKSGSDREAQGEKLQKVQSMACKSLEGLGLAAELRVHRLIGFCGLFPG